MATILPFDRKSALIELEPSHVLLESSGPMKADDGDEEESKRTEQENVMLARLYLSHAALLLSETRSADPNNKLQKIRWVLEDCARLLGCHCEE